MVQHSPGSGASLVVWSRNDTNRLPTQWKEHELGSDILLQVQTQPLYGLGIST